MAHGKSLSILALASVLACEPALAQERTQTFLDLEAGLGYSSNPLLVVGDAPSSAFGRVSAYGFHGWNNELGSTSLSAYVENSTYLKRYGNEQLFSLRAATNRRASETVTLYGSLGFSGDRGGQLGSRFFGVPPGSVEVEPGLPDSFVPPVGQDILVLNRRSYRLTGDAGASFALSPRDALTTSITAQRAFFSNDDGFLDYTQFGTTVGYNRQVSEFVQLGLQLLAIRADYSRGRSLTSVGPQATLKARLGLNWNAEVAAGFVRTKRELGALGGESSSTDLALDASACRDLQFSRLCARIARRVESSAIGASPVSTSAGINYYQKLDADSQIQASLNVSRTGAIEEFGIQRQIFASLAASYDRRIADRLSGGVSVTARRLNNAGPDPRADVGGSVFVRYRLGDNR